MKALVIYDDTGRIWSIIYGEETAPQGLQCMWVDIPDGATLERINVTDDTNPKPVFTHLPESDIGRLQQQVKELEEGQKVQDDNSTMTTVEFTMLLAEMQNNADMAVAELTMAMASLIPEGGNADV